MPPRDPHLSNTNRGTVHGTLLQARDIHNLNVTSTPNTGAPETAGPDVSLDPPRLATAVRGRTRLLGELTTAMDTGAPVPHVLTGPGGFGKTTVAAALAERAQADGRRVFWVRSGDVAAGMLEAAVEVGGSPSEAERVRNSPQRAARWVWQQLDHAPEPWLLVLDNADRPEEIDSHHRPGDQVGWFRASPAGFVLVTSRVDDPALWAPARMHSVAELDSAAAGAALADHAGEETLPGAEELAERLGRVPLALALAGRILATHRVLFPDARALCKRLDEDGLEHLDALAEPLLTGQDARRLLLSGVWQLSLEFVARQEPQAPLLLRLLAVLGSDGIPVPVRRLVPELLRDEPLFLSNEAELARTINALTVHGLVGMDTNRRDPLLRLHPLVAEAVCSCKTPSWSGLLDLVELVVEQQRDQDLAFEVHALTKAVTVRAQLLPPEEEIALGDVWDTEDEALFEELVTALGASAKAMIAGARALLFQGKTEEAERTLGELEEIVRPVPEANPGYLITCRRLWAEARLYQGDLDAAEAEYRRLLPQAFEYLGPDGTETSEIRFLLALLSARREDWDDAHEAFVHEVRERTRVHGAESAEVLRAKENLAVIAMERGHHATAAAQFDEVHALRVALLGEGHFATAQVRYHQAVLAYERGDFSLAHDWFTECVRVRERALGHNSPVTERTRAWVEHTANRTEPVPKEKRPPPVSGNSV